MKYSILKILKIIQCSYQDIFYYYFSIKSLKLANEVTVDGNVGAWVRAQIIVQAWPRVCESVIM